MADEHGEWVIGKRLRNKKKEDKYLLSLVETVEGSAVDGYSISIYITLFFINIQPALIVK